MDEAKTCPQCGAPLTVRVYARTKRFPKFCSKECRLAGRVQHGHSSHTKMSPTYNTWVNMVGRCTRTYHSAYPRYGAKGVQVCERWLTFANFLADMGVRPEGSTIDRFPNKTGNYEPGNCRWATVTQQQRNTKSNVMATFRGETKCVSEWAAELGINKDTLAFRVERGWGEKAFTQPASLGNRVAAAPKA